MMEHAPEERLAVVRCRAGALGWFLVVLLLLFGGFVLVVPLLPDRYHRPTPTDVIVAFSSIGALFVLSALALTIYQLRARIVADDTRLYWRGMRGWRSVRWDEIHDYYRKRLPKGQIAFAIITPQKTLLLTEAAWTNLPALRELVQQRATSAFAKTWEERGERADEPWPLVFDYNTPDNRTQAILFPVLGLILLVCYGSLFIEAVPKFQRAFAEMGPAWGSAMLACYSTVMLLPALLILLVLHGVRETRRRKHQRIVVTREGLAFENGDYRIETPWQEITELSAAPIRGSRLLSGFAVVSTRGTFDFTPFIGDYRLLRRLIERFAPEAAEQYRLKNPSTEDLLRDRMRTVPGESHYHYRTRVNRALLWLLSTYALVPWIALFLSANHLTKQNNNPSFGIGLALVLDAFTLWAWWRYRAAAIHTDAQGITQHRPFGKRFISWGDVQDYYLSGEETLKFGHILGSNARIRFWTGIVNVDRLKAEVAQRATHSRSSEWKPRKKA